MSTGYNNHLTVIGPARQVGRFEKSSDWQGRFKALFIELYERSPGRHVWWFETESVLLEALESVSGDFPQLVFLVDYECEDAREKGLIKAVAGQVESCRFVY